MYLNIVAFLDRVTGDLKFGLLTGMYKICSEFWQDVMMVCAELKKTTERLEALKWWIPTFKLLLLEEFTVHRSFDLFKFSCLILGLMPEDVKTLWSLAVFSAC